jgi:hypothetical protein
MIVGKSCDYWIIQEHICAHLWMYYGLHMLRNLQFYLQPVGPLSIRACQCKLNCPNPRNVIIGWIDCGQLLGFNL